MKITLKRTEEQVELIKAMASKNRDVAYEAQVALAEFIGPVLAEVVNQAPTLSNLFTNFSFNEDDNASIPLDLYYDITDEDYLMVWSQQVAGGLPSNTATPVQSEMKFTTYRLDSAVDFDKRYASRSRLDLLGGADGGKIFDYRHYHRLPITLADSASKHDVRHRHRLAQPLDLRDHAPREQRIKHEVVSQRRHALEHA